MKTELTLLERREIARKTVPTMKSMKLKGEELQGWNKLLAMGHRKETYDYFNIPQFKDDVDDYYKTHPIIIIDK